MVLDVWSMISTSVGLTVATDDRFQVTRPLHS